MRKNIFKTKLDEKNDILGLFIWLVPIAIFCYYKWHMIVPKVSLFENEAGEVCIFFMIIIRSLAFTMVFDNKLKKILLVDMFLITCIVATLIIVKSNVIIDLVIIISPVIMYWSIRKIIKLIDFIQKRGKIDSKMLSSV